MMKIRHHRNHNVENTIFFDIKPEFYRYDN